MQTLIPMHSRISSSCPSCTFCGKNGSAIDWRAAPTRSSAPERTTSAIPSGSVNRATPTMGFAVASRTRAIHWTLWPSATNRDGVMSESMFRYEPTFTSHRSTSPSARRTNSSVSSMSWPHGPLVSAAMRVAIAQSAPTAARTRVSVSTHIRARFSAEPPYSSVRLLWNGDRNCAIRYPQPAYT